MRRALAISLLLLSSSACRPRRAAPERATQRAPIERPSPALIAEGLASIERFECNRCHAIEQVAPANEFADCVGCHRRVKDRTFAARPEHLREWSDHLQDLVDAPSLSRVGERLRPAWLLAFLQSPVDLRPHLRATMPRLAIDPQSARAMVAFLTRDAREHAAPALADDPATVARGRALFAERQCGACHRFDDRDAPPRSAPTTITPHALAPDLRYVRERFRSEQLARWIRAPQQIKPDTAMPALARDDDEARALASYVQFAPLRAMSASEPPPLLAPLDRRVAWDEVNQAVFSQTCRHCHADRDFAFGDGGPGNTGGFGFAARGIDLASYNGAMSGMFAGAAVDGAARERSSLFAVDATGLPWIVRAMRARQLEEHGQRDPAVRGMPLGHPALTPSQIQLVRTWIASGRPLD